MIIVTVRAARARRGDRGRALLRRGAWWPAWPRSPGSRQALAKLSLDALIQRDVPETVRTSAFARSETLLQMSWVVGGAIGIVLPLNGALGMSVAAAIVAAGWLTTVRGLLGSARHGGRAAPGWPDAPRRGRDTHGTPHPRVGPCRGAAR